jgi:hypothetical protein
LHDALTVVRSLVQVMLNLSSSLMFSRCCANCSFVFLMCLTCVKTDRPNSGSAVLFFRSTYPFRSITKMPMLMLSMICS